MEIIDTIADFAYERFSVKGLHVMLMMFYMIVSIIIHAFYIHKFGKKHRNGKEKDD